MSLAYHHRGVEWLRRQAPSNPASPHLAEAYYPRNLGCFAPRSSKSELLNEQKANFRQQTRLFVVLSQRYAYLETSQTLQVRTLRPYLKYTLAVHHLHFSKWVLSAKVHPGKKE